MVVDFYDSQFPEMTVYLYRMIEFDGSITLLYGLDYFVK